jgi:hypothetical protein
MKKSILLVLVLAFWIATKQAKADFTFGTPVNLGPSLNCPYLDALASVSSDGLELYFTSNRPGGFGDWDIWVSTRASTGDGWSSPTNVGARVNTAGMDGFPCISADGLELYFSLGGEYTADLMVAQRLSRTEPWGQAANLGPVVNSPAGEYSPKLTADGLELYFISNRNGGAGNADVYVTTRASKQDAWGRPSNIAIVNSGDFDQWACPSGDGLTLLFQSQRPGGQYGGLYMSRRETKTSPWSAPVYLGLPAPDSIYTILSGLSADSTMLYLNDHPSYPPRAGGMGNVDIWRVPITPIVDFNSDEKVDIQDLLRLIESWGKYDPAVDIGPTPLGDGVVDEKDLEILMSYWQQEILPPDLVAYWRLDEAESNVAYDSIGENHGTVYGDPIWQPEGGMEAGALQFDGIDDYIGTDFVLNPADGTFSVFAWVNSSVPGGVVISQIDGIGGTGETWLGIEAVAGKLMTGLVPPQVGRTVPQPLVSESIIIDGQWHHVGFVWDGAYRSLYVDGVEVARDTAAQNPLKSATGGMYIGAGKSLDPASFFSGLIDDVRIYNRVVSP